MKHLYPLKVSYIAKAPIWSGRRLLDGWGMTTTDAVLGEAWMLTVRKNEMSVIQNGALCGMRLDDYITNYGSDVVGKNYHLEDGFPLLVKLIDAADRLSVQVHPDDDYAARVENDRGKTEMWYIVEADEGAEIIYGIKDGMSADEFREAVRGGRLTDTLHHGPVHAGETYFIPSGMLHAIGSGILIAEIQQNCDLTYRVYDYERRQADGTLRELHVDKALDVTVPFTEEQVNAIRFAHGREDAQTLSHCPYFRTRRFNTATERSLTVSDESFAFMLCIGGSGSLTYQGVCYPLNRADGYYLPAGLGSIQLDGSAELLVASIS